MVSSHNTNHALDNSTHQQQSRSSFSTQHTCCFTIPLSLGPQKLDTIALLDLRVSTYFLDENYDNRHKICLVQKSKPIYIKLIDGRPLLCGSITHETKPTEVTFEDHNSRVIFNIIKTPSHPIILCLSWLEQHNLSVEWRLKGMTFSKRHSKNQPSRLPKIDKPLFFGARAFVRSSKEDAPFIIYAAPTSGEKSLMAGIPKLYKDFEDVIQNKNANMLPEHRP